MENFIFRLKIKDLSFLTTKPGTLIAVLVKCFFSLDFYDKFAQH
jgi:hypothetical protein